MRSIRALLTVAVPVALLSGCAYTTSESVTWEDDGVPRHAHGSQDWWSYQFVYHPDDQVYFEPYTGTYHWFENGVWNTGDDVPTSLTLDARVAEVVHLQRSDFPWAQHNTNSFTNAAARPFRPESNDAVQWAKSNGWNETPDAADEAFATVPTGTGTGN